VRDKQTIDYDNVIMNGTREYYVHIIC